MLNAYPRPSSRGRLQIEMIRLGNTIRLTRREVERFTKITGMPPADVKTLDDLDEYIGKCKAHFWGVSEDYVQFRTMSPRCLAWPRVKGLTNVHST